MLVGRTNVPKRITVPAGTYYIGDPCYPIGDSDIYDKIWASTAYTTPAVYRSRHGIVYIDRTAYGDGGYKGTDGFEYGVDAGVISIISAEVIQHELDKEGIKKPLADTIYGGKLHTFDKPVTCIFGGGIFTFYDSHGSTLLKIDTGCEGSEDEDDW